MNNYTKNNIKTIVSISCTLLLIASVIFNIQSCQENNKLKDQLTNKVNTLSAKDELLSQVLKPDSSVINQYKSHNIPEINYKVISHKIDSLSTSGNLGANKIKASKGGYYSKTAFQVNLNKAKATFENDTIAEYKDNNWYLGFNKKTSLFDAQYRGEHEILTGYVPKFSIAGLNLGGYNLNTFKWSNDPNYRIIDSETIYYSEPKSTSDFKLYTNTEYRQGFGIQNKSMYLQNNTQSLYQGIGVNYRFKRHGLAVEGNYKLLGDDRLPQQELNLKYNFYLIK